jgi:hypothetical protein
MKLYQFAYICVMLLIIVGFFINKRQYDFITILLATAALISTSMYTFHHNRSKKKK